MVKTNVLVVDTGAFVKNVPLWEHGEKLVTVDETIAEIKDPQSRQYVEAYPVTINFLQPQPNSIKFINEFTKKTGDYHALSLTDIKLLALTYELEVEANGSAHLRTEPIKRIVNTQVAVPIKQLDGEDETETNSKMDEHDASGDDESSEKCNEEENEDGDSWTVIKRKKGKINSSDDDTMSMVSETSTGRRNRDSTMRRGDWLPGFSTISEDDQKLDDDEGWLTPDNYLQYFPEDGSTPTATAADDFFDEEEEDGEQEKPQQTKVACITGDFAMQNALRQIGLAVVGVDGQLIRDTRNYVLRCFACGNVTPDMDKLFCPRCGHNTLKRVSMTTDPDGTQHIWISRRRLNTRGMKFNLPKPRGGQHAVMPLLTADQKFPMQWAKRSKNINVMDQDYVAGSSPFSVRDVYSRAAQHGYYSGQNKGIKGQLKHAKIWKPKKGKVVKK